ncbi:MAG: hypothetical protein HW380_3405 [Magnetococcales bacterium]|nr:hypothetical protein [Magnetococcales bacterium]
MRMCLIVECFAIQFLTIERTIPFLPFYKVDIIAGIKGGIIPSLLRE